MKQFSIALLVALGACAGILNHTHVPAASRGDTPLIVVNHTATKVCWLIMNPPGTSGDDNWLSNPIGGDIGLEPGGTRSFDVKAGQYITTAEACYHEFRADNPVSIAGPTYLDIGGGSAAAPAGYAMVRVRGRAQKACEDPGFDIDAATSCCSKSAHREYQPYNHLICD